MRSFLLAALLLTTIACKRLDGDTVCEGTVVDRTTNNRVPNATVGVYQSGTSRGGLGGGYALKEEHQADAWGNFSFRIDSDNEDMILRASTPLGYETIWQEAIYLRGGRNNKKLVLKAQPPAWLRVQIIDQAPRDTAVINFFGFAPVSTGTGLIIGDKTLIIPTQGNTTAHVAWKINRFNQPLEHGNKDVYCPGLDTTDLQVIY